MPAKSHEQRRSAGVALAAKRGKFPVERLSGAARDMYGSMTESQLSEFARTRGSGPHGSRHTGGGKKRTRLLA